jgi:hypothetical protein
LSIIYHEVLLHEVVDKVRDFFERMPEIKFAVIFGSAVRRRLVRDIDIAVYSRPELSLRKLIEVANVLEDLLRTPVDLMPIEQTSPKQRVKILTEGIRVITRDSAIPSSLLSRALSENMDVEIKLREGKN